MPLVACPSLTWLTFDVNDSKGILFTINGRSKGTKGETTRVKSVLRHLIGQDNMTSKPPPERDLHTIEGEVPLCEKWILKWRLVIIKKGSLSNNFSTSTFIQKSRCFQKRSRHFCNNFSMIFTGAALQRVKIGFRLLLWYSYVHSLASLLLDGVHVHLKEENFFNRGCTCAPEESISNIATNDHRSVFRSIEIFVQLGMLEN